MINNYRLKELIREYTKVEKSDEWMVARMCQKSITPGTREEEIINNIKNIELMHFFGPDEDFWLLKNPFDGHYWKFGLYCKGGYYYWRADRILGLAVV